MSATSTAPRAPEPADPCVAEKIHRAMMKDLSEAVRQLEMADERPSSYLRHVAVLKLVAAVFESRLMDVAEAADYHFAAATLHQLILQHEPEDCSALYVPRTFALLEMLKARTWRDVQMELHP